MIQLYVGMFEIMNQVDAIKAAAPPYAVSDALMVCSLTIILFPELIQCH